MSQKFVALLAGAISGLCLYFGLTKSELTLTVTILYPMAWRCLYDWLNSKGFLPNFGKTWGAIGSYVIITGPLTYAYILETRSVPIGLEKMIDNYALFSPHEYRSYCIPKIEFYGQTNANFRTNLIKSNL